MDRTNNQQTITQLSQEILSEIQALPKRNTPNIRAVRIKHSKTLQGAPGAFVLNLAREILKTPGYRSVAYELIHDHRKAFHSLNADIVEELGQGINSWWTVDSFGRTISGPAWLAGNITDDLIRSWAHSLDYWWRRAALVSTVALNTSSKGGLGDAERTLAICCLLADDHEDMVVKGMSWALRELVPHNPKAVWCFLEDNNGSLAARVKREVRNKLTTGLKNP